MLSSGPSGGKEGNMDRDRGRGRDRGGTMVCTCVQWCAHAYMPVPAYNVKGVSHFMSGLLPLGLATWQVEETGTGIVGTRGRGEITLVPPLGKWYCTLELIRQDWHVEVVLDEQVGFFDLTTPVSGC